jgi:hypothetical protein
MGFLQLLRRHNFFIRLRSWEYWPFGIVQLPIFVYWFWLSLKARSFLFFTASNPRILMGGMFGESKYDILKTIPDEIKPKTLLMSPGASCTETVTAMRSMGLSFPVICKPDIGERGFLVKRVNNESELTAYLSTIHIEFIIQELVDLPVECGVFFVRYPDEDRGRVTSLTLKEMLTVTGDGRSTLEQLILTKDRARLQWERLKLVHAERLREVLPAGEVYLLNAIGNHCLGTKFLNGESYITPELSATFDRISKQIPEFYFGRFDLRTASIEDLYRGNVKILELNGCGAEPAHIYDPGFSLPRALGVLLSHWRDLYRISVQNKKRGVPFMTLREGYQTYRKFKEVVR